MLRRLICALRGHLWRLLGKEEDESLYYRCERCGKTQTYYF